MAAENVQSGTHIATVSHATRVGETYVYFAKKMAEQQLTVPPASVVNEAFEVYGTSVVADALDKIVQETKS